MTHYYDLLKYHLTSISTDDTYMNEEDKQEIRSLIRLMIVSLTIGVILALTLAAAVALVI